MKELDYKALGKNIRIQRIRRELKQRQLAEMLEVEPAHISHVETAAAKPSLGLVVDIANVLETDANTLLIDSLTAAKGSVLRHQIQAALEEIPNDLLIHILELIQREKAFYAKIAEN